MGRKLRAGRAAGPAGPRRVSRGRDPAGGREACAGTGLGVVPDIHAVLVTEENVIFKSPGLQLIINEHNFSSDGSGEQKVDLISCKKPCEAKNGCVLDG